MRSGIASDHSPMRSSGSSMRGFSASSVSASGSRGSSSKGSEGRLSFRTDANPRLNALEAPLKNRQIEVGVRRMAPLSLSLTQVGAEPLTLTLIRALDAMAAGPEPGSQR